MKIKFHIAWLSFAALTFIQTSLADYAARSVYVCKMTTWIQISPEGDLRNIERPEANLIIMDSCQSNCHTHQSERLSKQRQHSTPEDCSTV